MSPSARSNRARHVVGVAAAAAMAIGLSGCSSDTEWGRLGFPAPATEQGPIMLAFWQNAWIAAFAVGVLTWGLIFWAIIAYRRRSSEGAPVQVRYNLPLEIMYTVVPAVMVFGLFFFTARDQAELTKLTDNTPNVVNVVGFKWNWGFNYITDSAYETGTPVNPAELWMPVNERTRFKLTSPDVIHSFWVPAFLFKMDVVPGRENQFELTPNKIGVFSGKCAELCGAYHSQMLFSVHVVSKADYEAHIAALKDAGQGGLLETGTIVTTGVPQ